MRPLNVVFVVVFFPFLHSHPLKCPGVRIVFWNFKSLSRAPDSLFHLSWAEVCLGIPFFLLNDIYRYYLTCSFTCGYFIEEWSSSHVSIG